MNTTLAVAGLAILVGAWGCAPRQNAVDAAKTKGPCTLYISSAPAETTLVTSTGDTVHKPSVAEDCLTKTDTVHKP